MLLASRVVENEEFPGATVRTPAIIELDGSSDVFKHEMFGPIIFVVKAASTT